MAKLQTKMKVLEIFKFLILDNQEYRIQNFLNDDLDDYNLLDYKLDNEFNIDFGKDNDREGNNLEENHIKRLALNNNLKYNTPKPSHFLFKYNITL